MRGKVGHEKPECQLADKITKEEWWINQNKTKKKFNDQKIETSDTETSDSEDFENLSTTEYVEASHYGAHTLGWSRFHLRPSCNV